MKRETVYILVSFSAAVLSGAYLIAGDMHNALYALGLSLLAKP